MTYSYVLPMHRRLRADRHQPLIYLNINRATQRAGTSPVVCAQALQSSCSVNESRQLPGEIMRDIPVRSAQITPSPCCPDVGQTAAAAHVRATPPPPHLVDAAAESSLSNHVSSQPLSLVGGDVQQRAQLLCVENCNANDDVCGGGAATGVGVGFGT
jgi:hypothetical protein